MLDGNANGHGNGGTNGGQMAGIWIVSVLSFRLLGPLTVRYARWSYIPLSEYSPLEGTLEACTHTLKA